MNKIACAYVRISTEEQSTFSIDQQIDAVKKMAAVNGYELPQDNIFIDEGFSAKTAKRPALIKMLSFCSVKKNNCTAMIAYKIDRISRDTLDYLGIMKSLASYGVRFISCTESIEDSPSGEFLSTILAAAARYDNAAKGERVRANILQRMKSGLPHGKAKIGYLNYLAPNGVKTWMKDPDRFDKIKEIWRLMETGAYTLKGIADLLNSWHITTKKGTHFYKLTKQQAQRIFSDKTYAGYVISKKHGLEIKTEHIPQMISTDTFFRVQSILSGRRKTQGKYRMLRTEFPLRGIMKCNICEQPMRAGLTRNKTGKLYGYYFCHTHPTPCIADEKIDSQFLTLLRSITPDVLWKKAFLDEIRKRWGNKYMDYAKQQAGAKDQIDTLKELKHKIAAKNLDGVYTDEFTKEQLQKVDDEIMTVQTIQSESRLAQVDIEIVLAFLNGFLADLGKAFIEAKTLEQKRELSVQLFPNGVTFRNGHVEHLGLADWIALIQQSDTPRVLLSAEDRT